VNRDGRPDLVVANGCGGGNCANQGSVAVLLGNDNGTFQAPVTYSSGGYLTGWVTEEDVNGDGNLDVIVTNCTSVGQLMAPRRAPVAFRAVSSAPRQA
jgi:hypothetical protein